MAESAKFETDTMRWTTCNVCGVASGYFKWAVGDDDLPDRCEDCEAETN